MAQGDNPVVQQRRLRAELRRIREEAGLYQKDVADSLEWSVSKLIRIETGAVSISKTDLIALLHHYGVKDQRRVDELVEVAKTSRQSAWWDQYRDVYSAQFLTFLGYEASAIKLRQYQALTVPGLLQTRGYASALLTAFGNPPERVNRGVNVRLERQRLFDQDKPPEMLFILDEAVIRRWVGGADIMREQLLRLKDLNRRPNVSIQVARFNIGAYIGMKGSFTVFEFPYEEDDYAVLQEYAHRDVLVQNNPEEASTFVETFVNLEELAAPKSETDKIVDEALAAIPSEEPTTEGPVKSLAET